MSLKGSRETVCVVIAAMNAAPTIGRAVTSALRQDEVSEVVVVDDGSSDATVEAARGADDRSGRLRIVEFAANRGPAAARNAAIDASCAPLIAILDADDFFLDHRFGRMLDADDWDFIADNVVFIDSRTDEPERLDVLPFAADPHHLQLAAFVEGNISRRGAARGEVGFLKPVMRRSFLTAHGLRYDEGLRLGEDYDLYARALASGARYKVLRSCGYGAIVRADSLSGRHRTVDLKRLYEADRAILSAFDLAPDEADALARHERHVRGRYELRRFLDEKTEHGLIAAGLRQMKRPAALPAIISGIARDKWDAAFGRRAPVAEPRLRYLMAAAPAVTDSRGGPDRACRAGDPSDRPARHRR